MKLQHSLLAALSAVALTAAAGAHATTTFAQFQAVSSSDNFTYTGSGTNGSVSSGDNVEFSFLNGGTPMDILATFAVSGNSTTKATSNNGFLVQSGINNGTFSFKADKAFTYGGKNYAAGTNLLSGTFQNAILGGAVGSQSGMFLGDNNAQGAVDFTSSVLKFDSTSNKGFSLSLSSIFPPLSAIKNGTLNSFSAVSTGSFYANVVTGGGGGGVPEPASWALMLLGAGLVGGSLRVKRTAAFTA